jgi:hypothetical protein
MATRMKPRVTVTVDPDALSAVDRFVEEHRETGADRSGVFDEALRLWRREQRRLALIEQYSGPQSEEELAEVADWARIRDAAAVDFIRRYDEPERVEP